MERGADIVLGEIGRSSAYAAVITGPSTRLGFAAREKELVQPMTNYLSRFGIPFDSGLIWES